MIACNDYSAIEGALKSRCIPVEFKPLSEEHIREKLYEVVKKEGIDLEGYEIDSIVKKAEGDIRQALKLLEARMNASP